LFYSLRVKRAVLVYGFAGGLLIVALRLIEYRFLVLEHSVQIYGALIASLFAGLGIWLGVALTRQRASQPATPPPSGDRPFTANAEQIQSLGLTRRELEILQLIADGMSTREIASALFVSENTVKTHSSRLFGKLDVNRRTKAVQVAKNLGLIP
jgi:two-component system, NarL family, response regulator LiaR